MNSEKALKHEMDLGRITLSLRPAPCSLDASNEWVIGSTSFVCATGSQGVIVVLPSSMMNIHIIRGLLGSILYD